MPGDSREIERPIAIGVLKIKAKIGELLPAGKVGAGRGNKIDTLGVDFSKRALAAYRKLHNHREKLEEYYQGNDADSATRHQGRHIGP